MMKLSFLSLVLLVSFCSCNGQPDAYKKAKEVEKAIVNAPRPGTMPTTSSGWTMTAKVNGKPWSASSIMPPAAVGRIIGYAGENSYMGLPAFEKRYAKVGKKKIIGDSQSADMWTKGDGTLFNKQEGFIEITKMNGDWVEGTFNFTCTTDKSSKKLVVTEGFFRVQL